LPCESYVMSFNFKRFNVFLKKCKCLRL
jgi:hypothetical protein